MFKSNRPIRPSGIVLRLGLAAFLAYTGYQAAFPPETTINPGENINADAAGLQLDMNWNEVFGLGQMAVGGFIGIGLLTRLMALPVIGAAALSFIANCPCAGGACSSDAPQQVCLASEAATQVAPDLGTAILVGAAGLSMLLGGCGGLGLDRILFRRRKRDDFDSIEDIGRK